MACVTVYQGDDARLGQSFAVGNAPPALRSALPAAAEEVLADKKPAHIHLERENVDLLVERLAPPPQLVIFGAGHDVPPLVRLAKEVGFHVTVADRRADFAEPERFPGADVVRQVQPREAAGLLTEDAAAVIMNHHYETDAELLAQLVSRPLAYLGMLGPRKRTVKILRDARARGFDFNTDDLERLHAPVGLDLGAETPEQIALCILAELQAVVARRPAVQLRSRSPLADEVLGPQLATT